MITRMTASTGFLVLAMASSACGGGGGRSISSAVIDGSHDGGASYTFGLRAPDQFKRYQTFVAESHPTVTAVEVRVRRHLNTDPHSSISVELYETDDQHQPATLLAMSFVSTESLVSTEWAVLRAPLSYHGLVPGKEYAVVLEQYRAYGANDGFEWCTAEVSADLHFGKQENGVWIDESNLGDGWLRVYVDDSGGKNPAPGSLDEGFGTGGLVMIPSGAGAATGIQPDGKIIVAQSNAAGDLVVTRLDPDGTVDGSFGTGGTTTTFSGEGGIDPTAIAVQPDGKIVVVGTHQVYNINTVQEFALARFEPDGSIDTSLNTSGTLTTPIGTGFASATAVALQPDGKLVVVGTTQTPEGDTDIAVARYDADGTLDATFNTSGLVRLSLETVSPWAVAGAVAIQPDGKIVVAGTSLAGFAVVRLGAEGSLDPTFHSTGVLTTRVGGFSVGNAAAIQPDGRIVVAGSGLLATGERFALMRCTGAGALDTTFNGTGSVATAVGELDAQALAVATQPDGRIVTAGYAWHEDGFRYFALARHLADGQLDTSFHGTGTIDTSIGPGLAADVIVQPDGKIVAAGPVGQAIAIMRYHP